MTDHESGSGTTKETINKFDLRECQKKKKAEVNSPLSSKGGSAVQCRDALGYLVPPDSKKCVALGALEGRS